MESNLGITTTIQVYYLGKHITQIREENQKTRKLERAVGGSALKYFLTLEIKTSSEDFTCKKHSMALNVTSVFIRQAPNTNSKT